MNRIERIDWLDSCSHDGWHSAGDIAYEPVKCVTVGYLVHETDTSVTLAQSVHDGDQRAGVMTIPKAVIQTRMHLKGN